MRTYYKLREHLQCKLRIVYIFLSTLIFTVQNIYTATVSFQSIKAIEARRTKKRLLGWQIKIFNGIVFKRFLWQRN